MPHLKEIHDQLSEIDHVFVCIDPVDLDNIWLYLWAPVRVSNAKIHIVLSPRVLDLRVPNFGDQFGELFRKVGAHYMLDVLEKDAEDIYEQLGDKSLQAYFARDSTFQDDPHTRVHIPLYMRVSALRIPAKIRSKGHPMSRIDMSWDERSMDTIMPGIRHPTHVLDMLYACTQEEKQEALNAMVLHGLEREEGLVAVMEKTGKRLAEELGYQKMEDVLGPSNDVIKDFQGQTAAAARTLILGGGPFTEMRRLLTETALVPVAIVAMARTWFADVNIFPNNYNDLMDLDASMDTEDIIREKAIPTWIFPTECAKAKVKDREVLRPCALDFSDDDTKRIFQEAGDMESYTQARSFAEETKTLAKVHMFDVLTVVPLSRPYALEDRSSESYWGEVDGKRVIRIREVANGPINVFYPDAEKLAALKDDAMKEISYVLSPVSSTA